VPLAFTQARAVKYWNGSSWVGSQDFGNVKLWNGSTWQTVGIRPYADIPLVTFSPDGGTSGSPTYLADYQNDAAAAVTISASSSVVWNYSGGDGFNGYATVASGSSASSITFYALDTGGFNEQIFNVSASTGAETKYWYVTVTSEAFGDFQ
jgi:hypothetical protein